jgi:hypothetical protein
MCKKEDLYIKILSYGRANIGKPIKYSDLKQHLDVEGYDDDEFAVIQFFNALFINKRFPDGNPPGKIPPDDGEYFLEHSGYFNLLEHDELLEARKSSFHAKVIAFIAIGISIITMLISAYYSNAQLNSPTTIDASQFERLDNTAIYNLFNEDSSTLHDLIKEVESTQGIILVETKGIKAEMIKKNAHNKKMQPTPENGD